MHLSAEVNGAFTLIRLSANQMEWLGIVQQRITADRGERCHATATPIRRIVHSTETPRCTRPTGPWSSSDACAARALDPGCLQPVLGASGSTHRLKAS